MYFLFQLRVTSYEFRDLKAAFELTVSQLVTRCSMLFQIPSNLIIICSGAAVFIRQEFLLN